MEAVGLAIGVPGLAALFLKTSIQGFEVLANARDTSAEISHYTHIIKVEQQKLRDWKAEINRANLSKNPESPERERYLLILETLGRLAHLFADMAVLQNKYDVLTVRD